MSELSVRSGAAQKHSSTLRWFAASLISLVGLILCLMKWGGYLLESKETLPQHADVAVILEGSMQSENVRLSGAMQLLQEGVSDRVLLAIPPASYWGVPVPPMARHFLETNYGASLAGRVDFCEITGDVDSTQDEAYAIGKCIRSHSWTSVLVVTSNYHTRRAGIIWRKVMKSEDPTLQIWVHGVDDPNFQAQGWWRKRAWAKTWLMEFSKLIWTGTVGR
jgi:uncharacterized SAM-binding protein YcdF (DUF218 family)